MLLTAIPRCGMLTAPPVGATWPAHPPLLVPRGRHDAEEDGDEAPEEATEQDDQLSERRLLPRDAASLLHGAPAHSSSTAGAPPLPPLNERAKFLADVQLMRTVGRVQACAKAKRAEHDARRTCRPLGTQPHEAGLWAEPLPTAEHIEYRTLPPRPTEHQGRALFGWVPVELVRALEDASAVCTTCGDGEEEKGNYIMLCDGVGCHKAYHMQCLDPPMKRMPWKNRDWFCPDCRGTTQSTPATLSDGAPGPVRGSARPPPNKSKAPAELAPYEQQRLANIARNEQVLKELGLA